MEFKHEIEVDGVKLVKQYQKMWRNPNKPKQWLFEVYYEQSDDK